MWRCFLQLVGGLGIIVLAVAILPLLGVGGAQLFKTEMTGPMKDTRLTPRIAETARGLWVVYFIGCVACFFAYRWAGMSWPDAFMHMCTTMSLAGFSSHDASFGYWNSPLIEAVAVFFMMLAGISVALYFVAWRRRSLRPLWRNVEARAFVGVMAGCGGLHLAVPVAGSAPMPATPRHCATRCSTWCRSAPPPATRRRTTRPGRRSRRC